MALGQAQEEAESTKALRVQNLQKALDAGLCKHRLCLAEREDPPVSARDAWLPSAHSQPCAGVVYALPSSQEGRLGGGCREIPRDTHSSSKCLFGAATMCQTKQRPCPGGDTGLTGSSGHHSSALAPRITSHPRLASAPSVCLEDACPARGLAEDR